MKKMKTELGILGRAGIVLFIIFGPYYFTRLLAYFYPANRDLDIVLMWLVGIVGLSISIAILCITYNIIKWIINGD